MKRPVSVDSARVCAMTGFGLVEAHGSDAWRVAKERYVATSGITGVLVTGRVGPLPRSVPDHRGRYDTLGRTVYFADRPITALAEVLQSFRVQTLSITKDATVLGIDVDEYRARLSLEFLERGLPVPGEIPASWMSARSLYRVHMPRTGWWVKIDSADTLNAVSDVMRGSRGQLTLADVCGEDRGLTTELAQVVRDSVLDDDTAPIGISFPSKTAYGRCFAWWNRNADSNLNPADNDVRLADSRAVAGSEFRQICLEWNLTTAGD